MFAVLCKQTLRITLVGITGMTNMLAQGLGWCQVAQYIGACLQHTMDGMQNMQMYPVIHTRDWVGMDDYHWLLWKQS